MSIEKKLKRLGISVKNGKVLKSEIIAALNKITAEEEWMEKARQELEKKLDVEISIVDYAHDRAYMEVDGVGSNGESEWVVFKGYTQATKAAEEIVKEQIDEEPSLFDQDFISHHVYVTDTDKRLISLDMAEFIYEMPDDEFMEYADLDPSDLEEGVDLEKVREDKVEEYRDEVERELKDNPIEYVKELGYDNWSEASWLVVDSREAAEEAVRIDGENHYLDHYDGEEVELPSGAVAYGVN